VTAGAEAPKQRPAEELRRQIGEERDALTAGLDELADEVGEAADAARRRVIELGRRAVVIGPVVAGGVAAVLAARSLVRHRRRRS
jgi:hypothetical protein